MVGKRISDDAWAKVDIHFRIRRIDVAGTIISRLSALDQTASVNLGQFLKVSAGLTKHSVNLFSFKLSYNYSHSTILDNQQIWIGIGLNYIISHQIELFYLGEFTNSRKSKSIARFCCNFLKHKKKQIRCLPVNLCAA